MESISSCCPSEDLAVIVMILVMISIVFLLSVIPTIFYLITLQRALGRCQVQNQKMQPGLVWLMLIPFFNLVWHFIIVNHIADSLEREFASRNIISEPSPGKSVGLAMCILSVCGIIPYVGMLAGIGQLVCWIIYWVKIAGFSSKLDCADLLPLEEAPPV